MTRTVKEITLKLLIYTIVITTTILLYKYITIHTIRVEQIQHTSERRLDNTTSQWRIYRVLLHKR